MGATLVISPGLYSYNTPVFDCTVEGLYRFMNYGIDTTQRVVYSSNVDTLIASLSWVCCAGSLDEGLADKAARARTSKLRLRCGPTVAFVQSQLPAGTVSRTCHPLSAGYVSGFDDGHVALEVKVGGVWQFYDPNNHCRMLVGGQPAAFKDLFNPVGTYQIVDLSDTCYSIEPFPSNSENWDITMFEECVLRTPDLRAQWIRRLFQIPAIKDTDGVHYAYMPPGTESRQSYVQGLGYTVLSQSAWMTRFYP